MTIDFRKADARQAAIVEADENGCTVLLRASGGGISLPGLVGTKERYVVGDVEILEDHSVAMAFRCYVAGAEEPRLGMRFGLLPRFKTRICLDLDLLDNRTIFTNRTPGTLKLVVHGQRTERSDVVRFELGMEKTFHDVQVRLEQFHLTDEFPKEFPMPSKKLVDEFGQWKEKEWPGKIHSFDELRGKLEQLEQKANYPFPEWNRWGGDATRRLSEGTGFFATKKTPDGRWHLVDPDGCDFFSIGPCLVQPGDWGRYDSFEQCCDWLPEDDPHRQAIVIANPLGEDFSIMRTLSLNGMLTSLGTNYKRRNKNVRLYELGNIYIPKALPLTELPDERMIFTLGMYGEGDFYTMKGVVEEFLDKIGMRSKEDYDPNSGKTYLHPGRQANIVYEGTVIGYLGEVHPTVAASYGIGDRAYVAVLDMPSIMKFATFDRKYEGIAKFPAVSRDISMVVPKNILAGQIEHIIAQRGGKILESYELFDIYEGSQIQEGYKSMAYSVTFRAKDRTLEDADVNAAMKKILNGLEGLGIELRK